MRLGVDVAESIEYIAVTAHEIGQRDVTVICDFSIEQFKVALVQFDAWCFPHDIRLKIEEHAIVTEDSVRRHLKELDLVLMSV